ncbi:hypothetical protein D7V86_03145 [bacterium D16-51]|nr:hypothetical protein D7V96_02500 [bacterium D16-59]RKI62123.1 hypothetical protein D7V86_03145 [bacterium D16-51]
MNSNQNVQKNVTHGTYTNLADIGMSIAGITVGLIALYFCLFAYNWLTLLLSLVGIFLSAVLCVLKKRNDVLSMISIVLSTIGLLLGMMVSPEALIPSKVIYGLIWLVERISEMNGMVREVLRSYLLIIL